MQSGRLPRYHIRKVMKTNRFAYTEAEETLRLRESIVKFFLRMYMIQLKVSQHSTAQFHLLESDHLQSEFIYELRVKHHDNWSQRRMTISPLGEASGSKSRCFKVTYDDLLVIKIPPEPIEVFDKYIEAVNTEKQIVNTLKPEIECIGPQVSTLLKRISPFTYISSTTLEEFEEKCIERLKTNASLQKHLIIEKGFSFFMNLSKHTFLRQVIEEIHTVEDHLAKEITKQADSLWDFVIFEKIYGPNAAKLFFAINDIYRVYEEQLSSILKRHKLANTVSKYMKKEWFLLRLAGKKVQKDALENASEFIIDLNRLLKKVFSRYYQEITDYRKEIRTYVKDLSFRRNKAHLGKIITNLLELLVRLKEKGVAIRDLKPDNLFLIDHSGHGSIFATPSSQFSIGLIDFETAVKLEGEDQKKIKQPLLAGTPSYATPSHLFGNEVLRQHFDDLARILRMQDWQAVIAIIYCVVTGKLLAEKTSTMIPDVAKIKYESYAKNIPMSVAFKEGSRVFWVTAIREFKKKIEKNKKKLKLITVPISPMVQSMLASEATLERESTSATIAKLINAQTIFQSSASRKYLLDRSAQFIKDYRLTLSKSSDSDMVSPKAHNQILIFLKELEELKGEAEKLVADIASLNQAIPELSAYDLLELMFGIVTKAMYRKEWADLATFSMPPTDESLKDESYNKTISIAKTIFLEKTMLDKES
jgi:serine/threonine protein kinase